MKNFAHIISQKKEISELSDEEKRHLKKNSLYFLMENYTKDKDLKIDASLESLKLEVIDKEVFKLIQYLNENNIRYIIVKGYAYGNTIYKRRIDRPITDIDILIDNNDICKCIEIFDENEYYNPLGRDYLFTRGQIIRRKKLKNLGINIDVDIHTYLIGNFILRNVFSFNELYSQKVKIKLKSIEINTLSNEHSIIYSCIHYVQHFKKNDLVKQIWLYDIKILSDEIRKKDLEKAINIIKEKKIEVIVKIAIEETDKLLFINNTFKNEVEKLYITESNINNLFSRKSTKINIYIGQIKSIPKVYGKVVFLLNTVLPDKRTRKIYNISIYNNIKKIFNLIKP